MLLLSISYLPIEKFNETIIIRPLENDQIKNKLNPNLIFNEHKKITKVFPKFNKNNED